MDFVAGERDDTQVGLAEEEERYLRDEVGRYVKGLQRWPCGFRKRGDGVIRQGNEINVCKFG